MTPHYTALIIAYSAAAVLWLFMDYFFVGKLWQKPINYEPKKPYLEFIYAVIAILAILGIGQLYIKEWLIPNSSDNQLVDALNQFLIFSPAIVLVLLRKQSFESIWLPKSNIPIRILTGLLLAIISLFVYWLARKDAAPFIDILANIYNPKNISSVVQVFMEDLTIALIFVRLSKWIGHKWTIAIVALLFAAGHIPSMLSSGYALSELGSLVLDTGIGVLILFAVSKSKDIWWFFMIHYAMDMSQYYGGLH